MNSLERFYATAERRPVDRPAAWLGMPDPQALPGLFSYYGVSIGVQGVQTRLKRNVRFESK